MNMPDNLSNHLLLLFVCEQKLQPQANVQTMNGGRLFN